MRRFLKINNFILLAFYIVPFVSLFYVDFTNEWLRQLCLSVPAMVSSVWIFAIAFCIDQRRNSGRALTAIVCIFLLLIISSSWIIAYIPYDFQQRSVLHASVSLIKIRSGFMFLVALLMTFKIKKALYERSLWWIFVEIFAFPIGVITLTPEINSYLEEKEEA